MTAEVVEAKEFPTRLVPKYDAIRKAVRKLPTLGKGRAIRIQSQEMNMLKASRIAHEAAAKTAIEIQTARSDGYLYLRLAQRRQPETVLSPIDLRWKSKRERHP